MQLTVSPDNPLEWIALKANMVPLPLLHSHVCFILSKAVLEATDQGIFEAVGDRSLTLEEIADHCRLNRRALANLMSVLASLGYFHIRDGHFSLTAMSKKWMLKDSPDSVYGMMLFDNRVCWAWMDKLGDYLKTGEGIQYHDTFNSDQWKLYQNAMVAATTSEMKEFAKKCPVPAGASSMLDIGGSHGLFSVALCRKHPALRSTILDLPQAVEQAAPILARENMGDRVIHQPGNALLDDFGESKYDIILMSSLAHHFTQEQNREVARKAAKALKPGGIFGINEFIRPHLGARPELVGSTGDLFFGLSSTAGNWNVSEIQSWQKAAGLKKYKVQTYLTIPGRALVIAKK